MSTVAEVLDLRPSPYRDKHELHERCSTLTGWQALYACADSEIAAAISASVPGDRITLYVSSDDRNITSWSGGVMMTRVRWGKVHPRSLRGWDGPRYYIKATDVDGRIWSGTGAGGMYAPLRLTKAKS